MKFSNPLRLLILIASFAAFAWAQGQGSAAISGTVRDASGSVVAGAKVTVTQTSTGVRRLTQTNSAGQFSAPSLAPGRYSVSIANPGFKTQVENVTILADQSRALNVKLQVGQVTQTVTVNTSAVHANTTSPVLSQVIPHPRGGSALDRPQHRRSHFTGAWNDQRQWPWRAAGQYQTDTRHRGDLR